MFRVFRLLPPGRATGAAQQVAAPADEPVTSPLLPSLASSLPRPHPDLHSPSCAMHTLSARHTFTPMFTTVASRRSKTREVTPSPRSLASQQLQRKVYLVPWVGTAKQSSSTSQQLSGEAPSWPSWEGHNRPMRI